MFSLILTNHRSTRCRFCTGWPESALLAAYMPSKLYRIPRMDQQGLLLALKPYTTGLSPTKHSSTRAVSCDFSSVHFLIQAAPSALMVLVPCFRRYSSRMSLRDAFLHSVDLLLQHKVPLSIRLPEVNGPFCQIRVMRSPWILIENIQCTSTSKARIPTCSPILVSSCLQCRPFPQT